METITKAGITHSKPIVTLLHATPLWTAEVAGRTAYDSFLNSEHESIVNWDGKSSIEDVDSSKILSSLAWVHHHHSVLELLTLTFSIKGTSRGVLVEHTRHRHQSLTVRSTRYTMSTIINAFMASDSEEWFINKMLTTDYLVITDPIYNRIEWQGVFNKLRHQLAIIGNDAFDKIAVAKSSLPIKEYDSPEDIFSTLQSGKKKRNIGDNFKHIITDNFKVDMVVTFNLRSLKNYIDLRANGAAWFQIQWLAEAMVKATPRKYLDLIVKPKDNT